MVLRINDRPKLLHPKDIVRIDPYEAVMKLISSRNYQAIKKILAGKGTARELSAFPTALTHINSEAYKELIADAKKQGYHTELFKCFCIAKSLVRQFHDSGESDLESAIEQIGNCAKPVTWIASFPYESFKRMYGIYRNGV